MTPPMACPALTWIVSVVEPLAGTVTPAGNEIRVSPELVVPAPQVVPRAPAAGVNLSACRLKVCALALEFVRVRVTADGVLREPLTRPKLAEAGSNETEASAAFDRFSRPPPCWVG